MKVNLIAAALILLVALVLMNSFLINHNNCYGVQTENVAVDQYGTVTKYILTTDTSRGVYWELTLKLLAETGFTYKKLAKDYGDKYHEYWQGNSVKMVASINKPHTIDTTCNKKYCTYIQTFPPESKGRIFNSWWDNYFFLEMPGIIVQSNADSVYDNIAVWHTDSFTMRTIYAMSKLPETEEEDPYKINGEFNYTVNYNGLNTAYTPDMPESVPEGPIYKSSAWN